MKKITSIEIVTQVDNDPDLSHLGEWTDKPEDWAIVCRDGGYLVNLREASRDENGEETYELPERGRECRFFKPYACGEPAPWDAEYQKYGIQDWKRAEAYERGDWYMCGILAEASIIIEGTCQTISSGGLWGVESDSEHSDVEEEEAHQLGEILSGLGFSEEEIKVAFENAKHVDK